MTLAQTALDAVTVGRWQFGITTVYHFVLVPLTIGLSLLVAIMQTAWHRTGKEYWLQATRFFGKLLLINFALGVATGIVQEFQFGMNWSEYSRFVGDIFGAPLAVEALLAFFLESTFLGLWIFGWGRLSKGIHLATIWCVAIGTMLSAAWILAANAWMQHPVGARFNPETGRAELDGVGGFLKLITSGVYLSEYSHVITSAWLVAGSFVAGIAIWWMVRASREGSDEAVAQARDVWRPIARFGLIVVLIGGLGTALSGHIQGQEMVKVQPMKMAAAEGICVDTDGAAFTVAQFGSCPLGTDGTQPTQFIKVAGVASFMSHNSFTATSEGVADIQERMVTLLNSDPNFTAKYGDASQFDFRPPADGGLLVLPIHDRPGHGGLPAGCVGSVGHPRRQGLLQQVAEPPRPHQPPPALPGSFLRLDLHRDGSPAVGCRSEPGCPVHGFRPRIGQHADGNRHLP